jgi:hypothetical protein
MVLVRRSFTSASWRAATVIAPIMIEYEYGVSEFKSNIDVFSLTCKLFNLQRKEERMYRVRLCDEDRTGEIAAYSPLRGEIRAMPLECPQQETAHFPEPEARSHVNPYSFQVSMSKKDCIFCHLTLVQFGFRILFGRQFVCAELPSGFQLCTL